MVHVLESLVAQEWSYHFDDFANLDFRYKGSQYDIVTDSGYVIEVKNKATKSDVVKFYNSTLKLSGAWFTRILVARRFTTAAVDKLREYGITGYQFNYDRDSLELFYKDAFAHDFPEWFIWNLKRRGYRIMDLSGKWLPQLHDCQSVETIQEDILEYFKRGYTPAKVYYTLAIGGNPKGLYDGNFYGQDSLIPAFDVDFYHEGNHRFQQSQYCVHCSPYIDPVRYKNYYITGVLQGCNGYKITYSGGKGLHVYLNRGEVTAKEYFDYAIALEAETFTSKHNGFDYSRVVKVPNSIDLSTQTVVGEVGNHYRVNSEFVEV